MGQRQDELLRAGHTFDGPIAAATRGVSGSNLSKHKGTRCVLRLLQCRSPQCRIDLEIATTGELTVGGLTYPLARYGVSLLRTALGGGFAALI